MNLSKYIERHLVKYIQQSMHDGYSINSIKHSLLSKGHHINIIDKSILYLEKRGFRQIIRYPKPQQHNIDQEMFNYMVHLLVKYVKQQQNEGFLTDDIRNALLHYGHSYDVILHSLDVVKGKKNLPPIKDYHDFEQRHLPNRIPVVQVPKEESEIKREVERERKTLSKFAFTISFIFVLVFLLIMSIFSDTSFIKVIIAFAPLVISLIFIEAIFMSKGMKALSFIIPIILVIGLKYAHMNEYMPILENVAIDYIIVANLVVSFAIIGFYYLVKD